MTSDELETMLRSDEGHWWYRGRRRVLCAQLDRLPIGRDAQLLDAGCGSGRTLDELARYGSACGVELSEAAVMAARRRGHRVHAGRVEAMPFGDAEFDVVTCLDVIEHTPDDRVTLAELRRVTRPGGLLVVTVPAYPALWSWHDEANRHFRRYDRTSLRTAARATGWQVLRDTYFNALLLAPAATVRIAQRHLGRPGRSDLDLTPRTLNGLLEAPLRLEARLLGAGGRLPFGLSLMAVLHRPSSIRVPRRPARAPALVGAIAAFL